MITPQEAAPAGGTTAPAFAAPWIMTPGMPETTKRLSMWTPARGHLDRSDLAGFAFGRHSAGVTWRSGFAMVAIDAFPVADVMAPGR